MERAHDSHDMSMVPHLPASDGLEQSQFDPLARMMAHEVRNILTPMRVKVQMALDHPEDEERTRSALQWAINSATRISAITDTILHGVTGDISPVPIVNIFEEACQSLPVRAERKPRVSLEIDGKLTVNSLPDAVRHIVLNLLLNADRASAANDGNVHVACRRSTWNTNGTSNSGLEILIEDDGRGLDENILSRLNGFGRGTPPSCGRKYKQGCPPKSSGLSPAVGLFVVEKLIVMIGGEIEAVNMPVGGARIIVRIPDLQAPAVSKQSRAA